jgi:hypothetical protein
MVALAENRSARVAGLVTTRGSVRAIRVGKRAGVMAVSRQRRVAISYGRARAPRLAVMRLDGSHRRTFPSAPGHRGSGHPTGARSSPRAAAAPSGSSTRAPAQSAASASLPCGYLTSAEWTRLGAHVWLGEPR